MWIKLLWNLKTRLRFHVMSYLKYEIFWKGNYLVLPWKLHGGHPTSELGESHQSSVQCSSSILKTELPLLRSSQPFVVTSNMGVEQPWLTMELSCYVHKNCLHWMPLWVQRTTQLTFLTEFCQAQIETRNQIKSEQASQCKPRVPTMTGRYILGTIQQSPVLTHMAV